MGGSGSSTEKKTFQQTFEQTLPKVNIIQLITSKISSKCEQKQAQRYQELFNNSLANPVLDRALGCVFGSFIGDALGAYCEFSPDINETIIKTVMKMPGGGTYDLKPGQFTDDSEMACHLTVALLNFDPKIVLKDQTWQLTRSISLQYVKWIKGEPFDVGLTCRKGIARLLRHKDNILSRPTADLPATFDQIFQQVLMDNKQSESNGSLMRIAPMALFFTFLQEHPKQYKQLIENQIKLIHPKPILQAAGFVWVNALFKVINRTDNTPKTFEIIYKQLLDLEESSAVKEWFQESTKSNWMNGKLNIGWAKIAWTYGMKILYRLGHPKNSNLEDIQLDDVYYTKVIREVIKEAGDTDTNAAIVGGMIGALTGFTKLPSHYLQKMMNLKFYMQEILPQWARPSQYEPFEVLLKLLDLQSKSDQYRKNHKNNPT